MLVLDVIFFGVFGLIIGSFLNVAVLRHNTGRSLLGRSGCLSCGKPLEPYMLFPVFSWLLLRGRCAMCGTGISAQYPLVESATSAAFACIALAPVPLAEKALLCIIAAILVAIVAYDMKHTIIPDAWVYGFAALAFVFALMSHAGEGALELALLMSAGPIAAAPLMLLWVATRGRGIGLGDAKLALGIGWLLGPLNGFFAVMLAFVIGAVISLAVLLPLPWYRLALERCGLTLSRGSGGFTMKSEVPFGPFLVTATAFVWLITTFYGASAISGLFLS